MEIIRIRVTLDGEAPALRELNKIDAKIDQINKKQVTIRTNKTDVQQSAAAVVKLNEDVARLNKITSDAANQSGLLNRVWGQFTNIAIGTAVSKVAGAFRSALEEMKAVDTELTNIQKVSGATAAEIQRIGDAAYATASKYGVAADEYLSAVYTFQKAGLGDSAEQLGELATKTMLVGDTTAAVASKFLIATNAAWGLNGSYSALSTVVDQADYINNNYATSLDKLAAAMPIVASTSANLGMSVEETMAVIGTITSITQETGTKAATAWRALAMNITGEVGTILDETGEEIEVTAESIQSVSDALAIYGNDAVKAAQQTGQLVNPMEAVMSLAEAYRDGLLNDIELQDILMNVGGKLRTNQLTALVKDLASETSIYREMLEGLGGAAGTADAEIDVMLSSWESKTAILNNTWTEFVHNTVNSGMAKFFLDAATAVLKFEGSLGQAAVKIAAIATALKVVAAAHKASQVAAEAATLAARISANERATEEMKVVAAIQAEEAASKKAQAASKLWLAGVGTAIAVVTTAIQAYDNHWRNVAAQATEASQKAKETAKEYEDQANTLDELIAKYDELAADGISSEEVGEIKTIQNEIVGLLGDQATAVDLVNGKYEDQKTILEGIGTTLRANSLQELQNAQYNAELALAASSKHFSNLWQQNYSYAIGGRQYDAINGLASFQGGTGSSGNYVLPSMAWSTDPKEILQQYNDLKEAETRMKQTYTSAELSNDKFYQWIQTRISDIAEEAEALNLINDQIEHFGESEGGEGADGGKTPEGKAADDAEDAAKRVNDAVNSIISDRNRLNEALSAPSEDAAFKSISEAVASFREMIDSGEINSRAFWNTAEFLFGPEVIAQYADNAQGLIELFEDAPFESIFNGENLDTFIEKLRGVSDEIAEVKENEDGTVSFSIKDIEGLADAWGMTADQILALVEYAEAFGEIDFEGSGLVEYLEYLGLEAQNGKFALDEVMGELEALGYTDAQIQSVVEQLEAMGAIDLSDTSDELGDTEDAAGNTEDAIAGASDEADDFDSKTTENINGQFSSVAETVKGVTAEINAASSAVDSFDGKSATATITTEYRTINSTTNTVTTVSPSFATNRSTGKGFAGITKKFAEGTTGAPGGPSLVGDEMSTDGSPRPELVIDRGNAYVAGIYGPEIVRLNPGATVFTAAETRDILSGNIPAFAFGTSVKSVSSSTVKSSASSTKSTSTTTKSTSTYRKITFSANGGSGAPGNLQFKLGNTVTLPKTRPVRNGYAFLGWARSSAAKKAEYGAASVAKFSSDVILYAVWQKVNTSTNTKAGASGTYSGGGTTTTTTTSSGGGGGGYSSGGGGGGGGSSGGAAEDPRDTLMQSIQDELTDIEYKIWEGQKSGSMSSPQAIAAYKSAMEKINGYIAQYQKMGEDSNSDYIQKLKKQWYDYADEVSDLQGGLIDELKDAINEQLSEAEKVKNERIKAIQDAVDEEEQLNALEEKRLTLLEAQDALLKAQSERTVRIYNAATGQWEWVADAATVKSAQKTVESAQKAFSDEASAQSREEQIAAIEAEYEALTDEWAKILEGLETPTRSLSAILSDINASGTAAEKTAATGASALSGSIASAIANMNGLGTVTSINGRSVMYGASPSSSGVITGGSSTTAAGGGVSYYINGVEISGDRAESMTIADLARSLSTLAIYNNP